jgi:hypothetical protein
MNTKITKTIFATISLIASILACSFPSAQKIEPQVIATEAVPTVQEILSAETPSAPPTELPTLHQVIPVTLPAERSSHAGDYDSSISASKKSSAGGDRFTFGRFERPFNANTMDKYFPHLDIVDTFVYQDATWIFGKVIIKGSNASNSPADKYAMELDLNLDGKGDWLIVATTPASKDWSVDGVQAYQDANKDVGNLAAMYTDEKAIGDGFEKLAFDQGTGDDPDTAWARISPDDVNTVELAVKRSVLGNPEKYLINMWAGTSLLDPALFDLNDHFTHEQAGAADPGLELYYPIKAVFEIDNSCRMAVGFKPTGQEPGICEVFVPEEVVEPSDPTVPRQPCNPNAITHVVNCP